MSSEHDDPIDREPEMLELENPHMIRSNQEWVLFTRHNTGPKLDWLERELTANRIPNRRNGVSPDGTAIKLEVHRGDADRAWEILMLTIEYPDGDDAGLPPEPGEEMDLDDLRLRQQDERGER